MNDEAALGRNDSSLLADSRDQYCRRSESQRVDSDREWCGQPRDQRASQCRSRNFGDGVNRLALAVRVQQLLTADEIGDEHVVGEFKQDRCDAGDCRD